MHVKNKLICCFYFHIYLFFPLYILRWLRKVKASAFFRLNNCLGWKQHATFLLLAVDNVILFVKPLSTTEDKNALHGSQEDISCFSFSVTVWFFTMALLCVHKQPPNPQNVLLVHLFYNLNSTKCVVV